MGTDMLIMFKLIFIDKRHVAFGLTPIDYHDRTLPVGSKLKDIRKFHFVCKSKRD